MKHREIDNLRFSDFQELRKNHKNRGLKEKCDIIEKHIGMSISLTEKKQQLQASNDKLRNKMAKERFNKLVEQGGAKTAFHKVLRDNVSMAAYAPDIVKWTQKDLKKIMNIDKDPNEDRWRKGQWSERAILAH